MNRESHLEEELADGKEHLRGRSRIMASGAAGNIRELLAPQMGAIVLGIFLCLQSNRY